MMTTGGKCRGLLFAALLLGSGCGKSADEGFEPLEAALGRSRPPASLAATIGRSEWKQVRQFYLSRAHRTAWTSAGKLQPSFAAALAAIEAAGDDALRPADYDVEWLRAEQDRLGGRLLPRALENEEEIVALELRTTAAVLRWAAHLSRGRFNPARRGEWVLSSAPETPAEIVAKALDAGRLGDVATALRPPHGEYHALLALRRQYAELAAGPAWPRIEGTRTLRPGARGAPVRTLRLRLAAGGDLDRRHSSGRDRFDDTLAGAVRTFQERHGLPASGIVDAATRAALNVSAAERLRQIDVNIERWRFAPRDMGREHVRVNIPDFYLGLMRDGQVRLGMRVVVGDQDTPTPVLSDEMKHIVFSPFWNIPDSIATNELLPALERDPEYLSRNSIELVRVAGKSAEPVDPDSVDWSAPLDEDLRFRQRPGSANALGLVKFVFPNHLSIYLHDTPADGLFSRVSRALSHGCVRVERPVTLAHALLAEEGWTEARIEEAMYRNEEQWIRLRQPMPVHLMYLTAWVDGSGRPHFRRDIYGHDARQGAALGRLAKEATPSEQP
jgi:murein L,D-transpeptidase YcbB/YkuD